MNDIKFKSTRFNPDSTRFLEIAKHMAKAFGYTADLSTDKDLAQLLRLMVTQGETPYFE